MLGILLCGILSELFQPGVISQAKSSLTAQAERVYKESPTNFMGQLLITLFRVGVLSMAFYLCCDQTALFSFVGFWVIFGLIFAIHIVKMMLNGSVDFTFRVTRRFGNVYEHYGNILTLVTVVTYPALLVLLRFGTLPVNRWVLAVLGALFLLLWTYRTFRQFVTTPRAILYVLMYICTVEILPWVLLFLISNQIISQI